MSSAGWQMYGQLLLAALRALGRRAVRSCLIAITVASCLSAVTWIVQRRMKIARQQAAEKTEHTPEESSS